MPRRFNKKYQTSKKTENNNYKFFLTNAFGRGREHYGLQICEDENTWSFMVLTHSPTGHYQLKKDLSNGIITPRVSFLNTSIRTKPKSTRLKMDTTKKLSKVDEEAIKALINKKPRNRGK